nr:TIGR03557 family F420-dependent LLM class oxidoreductase [Halogeometricum sp. CBA1124]
MVENAVEAEDRGYDFLSVSDHFHPWLAEQGESPFVWSTLGGVAEATEEVDVGVGVTCPTTRIHPVNVAQAAATTKAMLDGRAFYFGVGTGEALNEHVTGERWPEYAVRKEMLAEAIDVIRSLWTGEQVSHRGPHYTVETPVCSPSRTNRRRWSSRRSGRSPRGWRTNSATASGRSVRRTSSPSSTATARR